MKIEIELSDEYLHDLILHAGSRYWARELEFTSKGDDILGFTIVEHADGDPKTHRVTWGQVREGIMKMVAKRSHHFGDIIDRTNDMYTGDAIIQYAIFGELKYG